MSYKILMKNNYQKKKILFQFLHWISRRWSRPSDEGTGLRDFLTWNIPLDLGWILSLSLSLPFLLHLLRIRKNFLSPWVLNAFRSFNRENIHIPCVSKIVALITVHANSKQGCKYRRTCKYKRAGVCLCLRSSSHILIFVP